jgi:hypothetical protein
MLVSCTGDLTVLRVKLRLKAKVLYGYTRFCVCDFAYMRFLYFRVFRVSVLNVFDYCVSVFRANLSRYV